MKSRHQRSVASHTSVSNITLKSLPNTKVRKCLNFNHVFSSVRDEEYELRKKNDPRGELHGREPEPVVSRIQALHHEVWLRKAA